jgi:anti-sigma regulatory factor (Ser/Thr protein kinase)/anti-anti-sigma regulatory factor
MLEGGGGAVTVPGGGPGRPAARGAVAGLHEALLPAGLPVLPQAQVAARYLPAARDEAAGGGWFDAVVLPGGLLALVAGEVAPGATSAAAAAGQLRAVLNELLAAVPDLTAVLARADTFAARTPGLTAATMALAVLDPATGTLRYALCGHPAPLIVSPGGPAWYLNGGRAGPLGTGSVPVVATAALEPGELVLLYSDGLVQRPGPSPAKALSDLAVLAADAAADRTRPADPEATTAGRVCQRVTELAARAGYADDVAVLVAQRLARPVPALHLDLPARRASLSEIRREFGQWLSGVDPLAADDDALRLALGEIVSNAIEHAYPPGRAGAFEVDAELKQDGLLECRVTDHGTWREPGPEPDRGNGLMLASYLAAELVVSHPPQPAGAVCGSRGTVVTLRRRLLRPAVLAPAYGVRVAIAPAGPPFSVDVSAQAGDARVVVAGPTDSRTAERLAGRLLAACRGGTLPLTADLTGVTRLAGAGVQVLFQVRDRLAAHRHDLTLIAVPGSPAGVVLDRVCLPYAATR